jgi:ATP-dependent HslUV protease subunit HslV
LGFRVRPQISVNLQVKASELDQFISTLTLGNGDVLEPETGVMGVGSGGSYAQSAALALMDQPG